MSKNESSEQLGDCKLETYYSKNDLAKLQLFKGDYINWGYWKGLDISYSKKIDVETRIKSSAQLYELAFSSISINKNDRVLEVGCGKGLGCAQLIATHHPKLVIGMDLFQEQVNRALKLHPGLQFKVGRAEEIPFEDNFFTKLYSVEAAQHFQSIPKFICEAYRVLNKGGEFCVTTFFANEEGAEEKLRHLLPSIKDGSDKLYPINKVFGEMKKTGFTNIQNKKIGESVFQGWDIWMAQNGYHESWGREWMKAYTNGLIDYYIITARKL